MKLHYLLLAAIAAFLLSACSTTTDVVIQKGAKIQDEALQRNKTFTCKIASIGSIFREYGKTKDTARIFADYCGYRREIVAALFGFDDI